MLFIGLLAIGTVLGIYYLMDRAEEKRTWDNEARRLEERVALRQQYVGLQMDYVQGWESLGDTLREKGDLQGAQESYQTAMGLMETQSKNNPDAQWMTGGVLKQKMRLLDLQVRQEANPEAFGLTLETRDQLCSRCGKVNPGVVKECECGNMLATDTFWEAIENPRLRALITKDTKKFTSTVCIIVLAVACGWALPVTEMVVLSFATVCVIAFLFLRNLGNPTMGG
jgi:hypothetical protein